MKRKIGEDEKMRKRTSYKRGGKKGIGKITRESGKKEREKERERERNEEEG